MARGAPPRIGAPLGRASLQRMLPRPLPCRSSPLDETGLGGSADRSAAASRIDTWPIFNVGGLSESILYAREAETCRGRCRAPIRPVRSTLGSYIPLLLPHQPHPLLSIASRVPRSENPPPRLPPCTQMPTLEGFSTCSGRCWKPVSGERSGPSSATTTGWVG